MTFIERFKKEFSNHDLLAQAFTHKSFHNEFPKKSKGHNERLEFLGDAVIDLSLSDYLMERFPDMNEGNLSKLRASLVNEQVLSDIALNMGFDKAIKLGKGEAQTGGSRKPRLLASTFEAFVGCLYKEMGFAESSRFIVEVFRERLDHMDLSVSYATDYKTRLQEEVQGRDKKTPKYVVIKEDGPDHDKVFHVEVRLDDQTMAVGTGKSKKQAEQDSARSALEAMK